MNLNTFFAKWGQEMDQKGFVFLTAKDLGAEFDFYTFIHQADKLHIQSNGEVTKEIRALPATNAQYHSQSSSALFPHTECYEYPGLPPRYLLLWCVSPPVIGEGETTLADGYHFYESLKEEERSLADQPALFGHYSGAADKNILHPIMEAHASGVRILRFSCKGLHTQQHPVLESIVEKAKLFFSNYHIPITWTRSGELLVIDNYRMLHARNAFSDPSRVLLRAWIN